MSESHVFPGDGIAIIEEFENGDNTFDDGHMVRSSVIGMTELNKKKRTASVHQLNSPLIPQVNDIVIGSVNSLMSMMFGVTIHYVNGNLTKARIECINQLYNKKRVMARVGDIVALRIISTMNGKIHASIEGPELGVLFSKCIKCASNVIRTTSGVKCVECGWTEERKLSNNFGNANFIKLRPKADK
ncbi:MAG: exosome complex component Csl4 [Marine Group I thaumarchaeote]|nr:MAG: exosome complex component Csl4 [Marine Group I thaumarchaeote]